MYQFNYEVLKNESHENLIKHTCTFPNLLLLIKEIYTSIVLQLKEHI